MAAIFGKKKTSDSTSEWTKTGSFMNKPRRGWLHAEDSMKEGGVCYAVRYVGCLKVLKSMRTLPYDLRQQVTREAILHVCEKSGYHIGKKKKASKGIVKVLGDLPNMTYTGTNVNMTVSASGIKLVTIDNGKVIARHDMQGISFASGGEKECIDMVGYIAKDEVNGRACHVIDCGGGLAYDVINTIGQAFEIRFKMFLENPPQAMEVPEKFSEAIFDEGEETKYNEVDESMMDLDYAEPRTEGPAQYQHAITKDSTYASLRSSTRDDTTYDKPENARGYDVPRVNTPLAAAVGAGYDTPKRKTGPPDRTDGDYDNPFLMQTGTSTSQASSLFAPGALYDNPEINAVSTAFYDNPLASGIKPPMAPQREDSLECDLNPIPGFTTYDNANSARDVSGKASWATFGDDSDLPPPPPPPMTTNPGHKDYLVPVDSQKKPPPKPKPYAQSKAEKTNQSPHDQFTTTPLHQRDWFHGKISRAESELRLEDEGDFLIRESKSQPGQYVLSGVQKGNPRHLLLVDPQGHVRTKDRVFDSVGELVDYHLTNGLPIISAGSELIIKNPVIKG